MEQEISSRSLVEFIKLAWHVLEPATPYIHNWHLDAMAEHLEAVTDGQINRLLFNVPPGTTKSMLTSVLWPAWEWGPKGMPAKRIISASYEETLATRDCMKMRRLVESDWFQQRWPTQMVSDQNAKTYFENSSTGFRQSCPVKSMTGRRGDCIVWDDPHSVESALSDPLRETTLRVFTETLPSRLSVPTKSAIIIDMQRLHEKDVSGYILENDLGYVHVMLPMEYEPERQCRTHIGFKDPRTVEGELLFPERFPQEVIDRDKKVMGSYATAGQFQQRPAPRTGGLFDWESIQIVEAVPKMKRVVRYWDKAGTNDAGCFTAGVKIGEGVDGLFYMLDVVRGQWAAPKRERTILQTAQLDGKAVTVWVEQEPGSGGKESAEATVRNLAGFVCKCERPTGDKAVRAEPYAVQVEAGNVRLLSGAWNSDFIDEHKTFPRGKYKDQIDATSGGFNKIVPTAPMIHIG